MNTLRSEVHSAFTQQTDPSSLLSFSSALRTQMREHLHLRTGDSQCMLPSFNYDLPTGQEQGIYLALEVGGSNLRAAIVELGGHKKKEKGQHDDEDEHELEHEHEHERPVRKDSSMMRIVHMETSPIGMEVKLRTGREGFIDWMAERVGGILLRYQRQEEKKEEGNGSTKNYDDDEEGKKKRQTTVPLPVGVAWSFPIEQTSIRSGIILGMGKGFRCSEDIKGQDLGSLIQAGFDRAV